MAPGQRAAESAQSPRESTSSQHDLLLTRTFEIHRCVVHQLSSSKLDYRTHTCVRLATSTEDAAWQRGLWIIHIHVHNQHRDNEALYLLGLLAMINCGISSYQYDN